MHHAQLKRQMIGTQVTEEHACSQEPMAPHGAGPQPQQDLKSMLATIRLCLVQQAYHDHIIKNSYNDNNNNNKIVMIIKNMPVVTL